MNYNSWVGKKVRLSSGKRFASGNTELTVHKFLPGHRTTFYRFCKPRYAIFLFEESDDSVACFRCELVE